MEGMEKDPAPLPLPWVGKVGFEKTPLNRLKRGKVKFAMVRYGLGSTDATVKI